MVIVGLITAGVALCAVSFLIGHGSLADPTTRRVFLALRATRIGAAAMAGAALAVAGMMIQAGFTLITFRLAVLGLLLLFASPTATHALAKAALARGVDPLDTGDDPSKR